MNLGLALLAGSDATALSAARGIAEWDDEVDGAWLDLAGLPVRVTAAHLMRAGAVNI